VGVAKSLFTLPLIPSHQGRGSLIVDTLELAAGWFIANTISREAFRSLSRTLQFGKVL